jgi:glycosyltransferase involved in cell wall biosynthesis
MTRPIVVINALSAVTGGGLTYARNLLARLDPDAPIDVKVLIAPRQRDALPDGPYEKIECPFPSYSIVHQLLWERVAIPRLLSRLGANVYYVLSGTLAARPRGNCISVVAFRNVLPFSPDFVRRYGLTYTQLRLWTLRFTLARSFARADIVIFISKHGEEMIDRFVPNRHGRSVVIPHGVGDAFIRGDQPAPPDPRWPDGYVLYPSILDVYKAQTEVIEAWGLLRSRRETPEKLVLAGPEWPPYARKVRRKIVELGLEDEVVVLGPVNHAELPGLCQNAKLNVFASRLENCPNILLELLASGRPILSSDDPPMPEFGGEAAEYFDATDAAELAEKLADLIDDEERQAQMARAAEERAQLYRVDGAIARTWDLLTSLATGGGPKPGA